MDPQEKPCCRKEKKQGRNGSGIQTFSLRKANPKHLVISIYLTDINDIDGNVLGKQGVAWDLMEDTL